MENKIRSTFDAVQMGSVCEGNILRAMEKNRKTTRISPLRRLGATAAAFILVMAVTLCVSPAARAAVEEWIRKFDFSEIGMTIYEKEEYGTIQRVTLYNTESPAFAELREGRLYFTGNGEDLDITDQITENEPFFYTYTDESGIEVTLVVAYTGTIENFGIYQFLRQPDGAWITGTGRNFLNAETEARYLWVDSVWENLDIPWPIPE